LSDSIIKGVGSPQPIKGNEERKGEGGGDHFLQKKKNKRASDQKRTISLKKRRREGRGGRRKRKKGKGVCSALRGKKKHPILEQGLFPGKKGTESGCVGKKKGP